MSFIMDIWFWAVRNVLLQCLNASKPLPSTTDEWGTAKVVNKRNELSRLIFNLVQSSSSSTNKNQS